MTRRRAAVLALSVLPVLLLFGATPPRPGGSLRLALPEEPWDPLPATMPSSTDRFLAQSVFEGLTRRSLDGGTLPGLARSWERGADPSLVGAERWTFHLDPLARFPDGRQVSAVDVIRSWKRMLRTPISIHGFLLSPVIGADEFGRGKSDQIEGLFESEGDLVMVLSRPAPDLLERLAHPALAVATASGGTGPFTVDDGQGHPGTNRYHSRGRPFIDGFRLVPPGEADAALLLEAGEADAALLFGRAAGEALDAAVEGGSLVRLPGWDRTYALAFNPGSGFFRQENFRNLLSAIVDREEMLRLLFDGRGETVDALHAGAGPAGSALDAQRLPGTRSRLVLTFVRGDAQAFSIAARVKALWEEMNLIVDLEGTDPAEFLLRVGTGGHDVAVVLHHPASTDPVIGLWETLALHPRAYPDAIRALETASLSSDPAERRALARAAEEMVTGDVRLAPLVRLHSWLLLHPRLVGVVQGPSGTLRLDEAFFLP